MTPKWVSVALDAEGNRTAIDDTGRMFYEGAKGVWRQLEPPPPLPEPSTQPPADSAGRDRALMKSAIMLAKPLPGCKSPRWDIVGNVFGLLQEDAEVLCREFGFDPDVTISVPPNRFSPPEPSTDWRSLVEGAVRNARPLPGWTRIRWACVEDAFRVDSDRARALCREFGVDPYDRLETPKEE